MKQKTLAKTHRTLLLSLGAVAAIFSVHTGAFADSVVLYPLGGSASQERFDEIEDRVGDVLSELGHRVFGPSPGHVARPSEREAQMASAEASNAAYVLQADADLLRGQYRLQLVVFTRAANRTEELVVNVLEETEVARLRDILTAMIRPEGLGEDAVRLSGLEEPPAETTPPEETPEPLTEPCSGTPCPDVGPAEGNGYANGGFTPWYFQGGGGGAGLVSFGGRSGGLGVAQFRIGRTLDLGREPWEGRCEPVSMFHPSIDLQAGLDILLGDTNGFGLVVGARWFPIRALGIDLGVMTEVGLNLLVSGPRDAGFRFTASAVASTRIAGPVQIELSLPDFTLYTNGPGFLSLGASLRLSGRFE